MLTTRGASFWLIILAGHISFGCAKEPVSGATYVDSMTCQECHQVEERAWKGSHHDLAMQPATAETVLGDFDDTSFEALGQRTSFRRKGEEFWVNAEGPDGKLQDYQVAFTFGVEPLQQYLIRFPGGRLQCLTVAWDTVRNQWFTLYPENRFAPDDALHWTGRYQNWNMMCADCHSTHLSRNYDLQSDTYGTMFEELNVSCQACHGPGSEHIALARAAGDEWTPEGAQTGFVVNLRTTNPTEQIETCAPCHSRRSSLTGDAFVPGSFHDVYAIEALHEPLYAADGQMVEEVYVMGSFMQSKMHEKGVVCSDCHNPHSLELKAPGDAVCLQCHSEQPPLDRFPTLQSKNYDSAEHHHHLSDSDGARCKSCHMPATTYMQIDERYDHSLRIPRPDLTASIGTRNACNDCHKSESPKWAADWVQEWTGSDLQKHYGQTLHAGRRGAAHAVTDLKSLVLEMDQPGIVRVTAMNLLNDYPGQSRALLELREDPNPVVRAAALEQLAGLSEQELRVMVVPMLEDPARLVRLAAVRALAGSVGQSLMQANDAKYAAAFEELQQAYLANADMPSACLKHAIFLAQSGDTAQAVEVYGRVLELDPKFLPAVFNLANLLSLLDQTDRAQAILQSAIEQNPAEGELYYSLGLLLAQQNDAIGSANALRMAAQFMPTRSRVHYNLGLAAQGIGEIEEAEAALLRAAELDPDSPDYAYALATFYLGQNRFELSLDFARKLEALLPADSGVQQFQAEILRRQASAR